MTSPAQHLTSTNAVDVGVPSSRQSRRDRLRRSGAATAAAAIVAMSTVAGPLTAVSSAADVPSGDRTVMAQAGGVLDQAGGGSSSSDSGKVAASPSGGGARGGSNLDVAPNFSAPGISQGKELIGWAKAGAMVLGTLGLVGGVVASKVMQNAGNHHAGGVRQSAFGIGGALVLAGSAATIVPWLMG